MHAIVPDANVFAKLLHPEADSEEAKLLFKTCAKANIKLFVPELFLYEILEVTHKFKESIAKTLEFYKLHEQGNLTVVTTTHGMWLTAERIAKDGHDKSGFPSMYDTIYHAIAIELSAIFITADNRHYQKAKQHGSIALLKDWESVLIQR